MARKALAVAVVVVALSALGTLAAGGEGCRQASCRQDSLAKAPTASVATPVVMVTPTVTPAHPSEVGVLHRRATPGLAPVTAVVAGLAVLGTALAVISQRRRVTLGHRSGALPARYGMFYPPDLAALEADDPATVS